MRSALRCLHARRGFVLCAIGFVLFAAAPARSAESAQAPITPEVRLLNVWLDLRLVSIFYPETTSETLVPNLAKVAGQLNHPLPPIRFGETAADMRKFRVGAVMIKRNPPPETWILFTRSRTHVWRLMDDADGRLTVVRLPSPSR